MKRVAAIWDRIKQGLLPGLEEYLDEPLTEKEEQLVAILEVVRIEEHVPSGWTQCRGRRRRDRRALSRAFVAKAVLNLGCTKQLVEALRSRPNLRRLCGFGRHEAIPSAATFSRAFREFAESQLADRVHEALVKEHVGPHVVMHLSRDSTDIPARERAVAKGRKEKRASGTITPVIRGKETTRGRPRSRYTVLDQQWDESPETVWAGLSKTCDWGVKTDRHGRRHAWRGYKLHMDCADGGVPIVAVTTSASQNDSRVALLLAKRSAERVTNLYDLMDAGYDAYVIDEYSRHLGHVPIIVPNTRGREERIPFDPATAHRFRERSTVERAWSRLKDEFGGRVLRVRGYVKVHAHLMFGVLALFADQLLRLVQ
jgi:hypothetical protein